MTRAHLMIVVLISGCMEGSDPDQTPVDGSTWIGTYEVISSLETHTEGSTVSCDAEPRTPNNVVVVNIKPFDINPDSLDVEVCADDGTCETVDIFRPASSMLEHSGASSLGDAGSTCMLRADHNFATLDGDRLQLDGKEWLQTIPMSTTCNFEQAHALLDTPNCERLFIIDARRVR